MSDEKLENIVSEYAELAKDKNIDTAALLMNALQQEDQNRLSTKTKRIAYLVSIAIPPSGFLFALAFYFSDKSDGKTTAYACIILTVISLVISIILFKTMFNSAGVTPAQLQEIKPADIYQLTQ